MNNRSIQETVQDTLLGLAEAGLLDEKVLEDLDQLLDDDTIEEFRKTIDPRREERVRKLCHHKNI